MLAKTESLPASRRRRRRNGAPYIEAERRRPAHEMRRQAPDRRVANSVLWLRCARLGRWFDEYWDDRTARLAA